MNRKILYRTFFYVCWRSICKASVADEAEYVVKPHKVYLVDQADRRKRGVFRIENPTVLLLKKDIPWVKWFKSKKFSHQSCYNDNSELQNYHCTPLKCNSKDKGVAFCDVKQWFTRGDSYRSGIEKKTFLVTCWQWAVTVWPTIVKTLYFYI